MVLFNIMCFSSFKLAFLPMVCIYFLDTCSIEVSLDNNFLIHFLKNIIVAKIQNLFLYIRLDKNLKEEKCLNSISHQIYS